MSWCENVTQLIRGQTHVFMEISVAKANDLLSKIGAWDKH